jgi:hypothetical protein
MGESRMHSVFQKEQSTEAQHIGLVPFVSTPLTALRLRRLPGNRAVTSILRQRQLMSITADPRTNVVQRYEEFKLSGLGAPAARNSLFDIRNNDGEALSGAHNYAAEMNNYGNWAKSQGNRHAEVKVLLGLRPSQPGQQISIVSEFQPCIDCENDMREYEQTHNVNITCFYFLDYAGRGEGDKEKLRQYYKAAGRLAGGARGKVWELAGQEGEEEQEGMQEGYG